MTWLSSWQVILAIGNVLNEGTFRGAATGFQVGDLLKVSWLDCSSPFLLIHTQLKDIRSGRRQCPSMLHYVAGLLLRTSPLWVALEEDMPSLSAAARRKQS